MKELLRMIPKMDVLQNIEEIRTRYPDILPAQKKMMIKAWLEKLRQDILSGRTDSVPEMRKAVDEILDMFASFRMYSLKKAVNATGIVIHTNLGRAPLSGSMMHHLNETMSGYSTLEYDTSKGCRGSRHVHVEKQLAELTGAKAAMVVNNNAAAVFLILNTLAYQKKVAVSYGELVEIGGSFRVPDIMKLSGAELVEVGTTNRTRIADYEKAQQDGAEYFLKVHKSNFRIVGFCEEVSLKELAGYGHQSGTRVICDLGSAFITDETIPDPLRAVTKSAGECIREGADIVCFSGDKLLGASQCGIILGGREEIDRMKKNPFARMFRIDKLSLCVLEENLRLCMDRKAAKEQIPVLSMLCADPDDLKQRAEKLRETMETALGKNGVTGICQLEVCPCMDEPGGGSLPGAEISGYAVSVRSAEYSADAIAARFRNHRVPVITRIRDDAVLISVRTLFDGDDIIIAEALTGDIAV